MADTIEDDIDNAPSILLPCATCNRTFRPEALAKHAKVCEKTLKKKRKVFDSSKQRIQGTELAEFLPVLPTFTKKSERSPVRKVQAQSSSSSLSACSKTSLSSPKSKWREKHSELVQTIQAARLPPGQAPPAPAKLSSQELCPYCERSFGPKAYDRHLEWCREQRNRIQPKSPASQQARQRQEARTKYQAPLTNKCRQKRSGSRDKLRDPSPSSQLYPHQPRTPTMTRRKTVPTAAVDVVSSPCLNSFVKGTPLRSSTRSTASLSLSNKKPQLTRSTRISVVPSSPPSVLTLDPDGAGGDWPCDLVIDVEPPDDNDSTDSQSISTFQIEFLDEYLDASTPQSVSCKSTSRQPSSTSSLFSSRSSVESCMHELNKTFNKEDLKDLLVCTTVKSCQPRKKDKCIYGTNKRSKKSGIKDSIASKNSDVKIFDLSPKIDLFDHYDSEISKHLLNDNKSILKVNNEAISSIGLPEEKLSTPYFNISDVQCDLIDFESEITIPGWEEDMMIPQTDQLIEDVENLIVNDQSDNQLVIINNEQSILPINTMDMRCGHLSTTNTDNESEKSLPDVCCKSPNSVRLNFGVFVSVRFPGGQFVLDLPLFNTFASDRLINEYLNYYNLENIRKCYIQNIPSKSSSDLQYSRNKSSCFQFRGAGNQIKGVARIKSVNDYIPKKKTEAVVLQLKNKINLCNPSPAKRRKRASSPIRNLMLNAVCAQNESDSDCYWDYYETDVINKEGVQPSDNKVKINAAVGAKQPDRIWKTYLTGPRQIERGLLNAHEVKGDDYQTIFIDAEDRLRESESDNMSCDSLSSATAVYKRDGGVDILILSRQANGHHTKCTESSLGLLTSRTQQLSPRIRGGENRSVYTIEWTNNCRTWMSSCENYNKLSVDGGTSQKYVELHQASVDDYNSKLPLITKKTESPSSVNKRPLSMILPNQNRCVDSESRNLKKCISEKFTQTKYTSQLPVLVNKKIRKDEKTVHTLDKDTHWTERVNQGQNRRQLPDEVVKVRKAERMARSLRRFLESEVNAKTDLCNLGRSRRLTPIASARRPVDSSSESGEYDDAHLAKSRPQNQKYPKGRSRQLPPLLGHPLSHRQKHHHNTHFDGGQQQRGVLKSSRTLSEPEPYDPFKSAERQMLELLGPDKEPPKLAPITPISKPPAVLSSPTSAFTKFSSIITPEPLFISEDDNNKSRHSSEKSDSPLTFTSPCDNYPSSKDSNQNPISLSTLSLCSTISIESVDGDRNNFRYPNSAKVPEKKTPILVRRTSSAIESRRPRDPFKGMLKMEDMLYGTTKREGERYFGSPIITGQLDKDSDDHSSNGSLYKAVSDAETLNAEQELLKSMSEFEKLLSSSSSSPSPSSPSLKLFPSLGSSYGVEELPKPADLELHSIANTTGPDSAYSSLNRKSPVGGEQERGDGGEVARFCHECGAKYPLVAAKFCCQCGVRRLVI